MFFFVFVAHFLYYLCRCPSLSRCSACSSLSCCSFSHDAGSVSLCFYFSLSALFGMSFWECRQALLVLVCTPCQKHFAFFALPLSLVLPPFLSTSVSRLLSASRSPFLSACLCPCFLRQYAVQCLQLHAFYTALPSLPLSLVSRYTNVPSPPASKPHVTCI